MAEMKKALEKKLKTNVDTRGVNNYFDNIKRARSFAAKNDSKVEIVNLDSVRRYRVVTLGVGIR